MPRTVTLGDLATRVRYIADLVNNQFVTDTMIYQFINDGNSVLYNKLLRADPERYMREHTPTIDANGEFSTEATYFGTIAIDWSEDSNSGIWHNVPRIFATEANAYDHDNDDSGVPSGWHPIFDTTVAYGVRIRLLPNPSSRYTIRHKYTVAPAELTVAGQIIDGISGWEEYLVLYAAIKCKIREESSTTALENQLARYEEELDSMIEARNVTEAGRVIDTRTQGGIYDPSIYNWYSRRG